MAETGSAADITPLCADSRHELDLFDHLVGRASSVGAVRPSAVAVSQLRQIRCRLSALTHRRVRAHLDVGESAMTKYYACHTCDGAWSTTSAMRYRNGEAGTDSMRELIEDLWPELVHKLPPKR